jgi:hypothetical protein
MSEKRLCAYCLRLVLSGVGGPDGMLAIGVLGTKRITSGQELEEEIEEEGFTRFQSLSGIRVGIFEKTQVRGTSVCIEHLAHALRDAGLTRG